MKNFVNTTVTLCLATLLGACVADGSGSQTAQKTLPFMSEANEVAALTSSASRIKADVDFLADDAREGREAGTPGYDAAADYVAARMSVIGLKKVGDSWFQPVTLRQGTPVLDAASMSVTSKDGQTSDLTSLEDFRVFPELSSPSFAVSAPAVFVGYGVHAPSFGVDDYDGLDVDGKIIVYFSGAPEVIDSEARAHFGRGASKLEYAASQGAIGAIALPTVASEERFPWERMVRNPSRASIGWAGPNGETADRTGVIGGTAVMNSASAQILFEGAPSTYQKVRDDVANGTLPKGFDLAVNVAMAGALEFSETQSANVIGLIEGSDPALKDEYLILTAHLDHVGIDEEKIAKGEDGINNGAMDNALGVSVMLDAARALLEDPPARSILVAAVTAEEKGLIGADYLAEYPVVPGDAIIANINLDMPLMLHSFNDVVAFGGEHSSLGGVAEKAVADAGAVLSPDPIPEQGIFTRSDHYRFVQRGIPSLFLWPGFGNGGEEAFNEFFSTHYHQPSDEPTLPVLYDDVARFTDANVAIARAVANDPVRPTWNEGNIFGRLFAGGD